MSLFDSINETNRAYCLHHVKRSMFLYKSMNYTAKNELYGFFTDLMDSYGFCSQSLQVWSTQGWQVWVRLTLSYGSKHSFFHLINCYVVTYLIIWKETYLSDLSEANIEVCTG